MVPRAFPLVMASGQILILSGVAAAAAEDSK
jgi:hypothetical protein